MRLIWVGRETENFLTGDWTTQITLIRFNKIAFRRNSRPVESRPVEHFRAKGCPALDERSTAAGTVNWIKCTVTVIPVTVIRSQAAGPAGLHSLELSCNRHEAFKTQGEPVSIGEVLDAIWHMYRAHGAPLAKFHAKHFVPARCKPCFPRLPAH
jgi:hypothetical protein